MKLSKIDDRIYKCVHDRILNRVDPLVPLVFGVYMRVMGRIFRIGRNINIQINR